MLKISDKAKEQFVKDYADTSKCMFCSGDCDNCIIGNFELDEDRHCQAVAGALLHAIELFNKEKKGD